MIARFGQVRRNVLYNLGGAAAPLLLALVAVPPLAAALGPARFGVLALGWAALGWLALLNLGINRALTQAAAARPGADAATLGPMAWTAAAALAGIGAVGGAALFLAAPWLTGDLLRLEPGLAGEAAAAFRLLALAIPFTVGSAAWIALLEARHRFGLVHAVAVPAAVVSYLGPLLALRFADGLVPVIAVVVASRVGAWAAYLAVCLRQVPALRSGVVVRRAALRPLLSFAGWTSVSQLASPLMVYADRFVVGAVLTVSAVAFYATPQEVVLRLGVLSGAVAAVLFPAFAAAHGDGAPVAVLYRRGATGTFLLTFPAALLLVGFAEELLGAWMGAEYARAGAGVLRLLGVGLVLNGFAKVPSALFLGIGRPDVPAKLHLVELPLYALTLWVLVGRMGIEGAAWTWVLRAGADAAAQHWAVARMLPALAPAALHVLRLSAAAAAVLAVLTAVPNAAARAGVVLLALGALAALGRGWARAGALAPAPSGGR